MCLHNFPKESFEKYDRTSQLSFLRAFRNFQGEYRRGGKQRRLDTANITVRIHANTYSEEILSLSVAKLQA